MEKLINELFLYANAVVVGAILGYLFYKTKKYFTDKPEK